MVRNLQKYLSILASFLLVTNLATAQVAGSKSRLDIGKKVSKTTTSKQPIQQYSFVKPMPKEVKLNKPAVVSQYFRNALLNGNSKSVSAKTTNLEVISAEKSVAPTPENTPNDRLFVSEKINVSNIYPNPANDYAVIDYSITGNVNSAKITFSNLLGNEIDSYELDKNEKKIRVSTTSWDSGIYFYQLVVDGKKVTKKLLVRHN